MLRGVLYAADALTHIPHTTTHTVLVLHDTKLGPKLFSQYSYEAYFSMYHEAWARREPQADTTLHIHILPSSSPCELEVSNRQELVSVHYAAQGLGLARASSQRGPRRKHTPRFLSLRRTGTAPDCTRVQPSIPCHLYLECRRPTAVHRDGLRSTSVYRFHEASGATFSPPLPKQLKSTTGRHHLPHTYARQCNPHTILPLPGGITCRIHVHISTTPIPYLSYLERHRPTTTHRGDLRSPPACKIHETRGATPSPPVA